MSRLKADPLVYRYIISSPCHFVGDYNRRNFSIDHFWELNDSSKMRRQIKADPSSKNYFIISYKVRKPENTTIQPESPYFHAFGYTAFLSAFYGKRFDFHGALQKNGLFCMPNLDSNKYLTTFNFDIHNNQKRKDTPWDLNLNEVNRFDKLRRGLFKEKPPIYQIIVSNAAISYFNAVRYFEENPTYSFISLITAGEILSNLNKSYPKIPKDIELLLNDIENYVPDISKLKTTLLSQFSQIKQRFISTLSLKLDDNFYESSSCKDFRWQLNNIKRAKLWIGKTYDVRSKLVHAGLPIHNTYKINNSHSDCMTVLPSDLPSKIGKLLRKSLSFEGLERVIRYSILKIAKVQFN